jgi:hypothetical protein
MTRALGAEKSKAMESGLSEQEIEEKHCAAAASILNFDIIITTRK